MEIVKWVSPPAEEEVKRIMVKTFDALRALYEALDKYYQEKGKYPADLANEFISKTKTSWVFFASTLKLDRQKALDIEKEKDVSKKLLLSFELVFEMIDKMKEQGILDVGKKPKFETRKKAEGGVFGFG